MNRPRLILIGTLTELERIQEKQLLYSESEEVREKARELGFRVLEEKDVVSVARLKQANEEAFQLAARWYTVPSFSSTFRYGEISLGSLIEKDFTYCLIRLIRQLLIVKGIVEKEGVKELVVFKKRKSSPKTIRWGPDEHILGDIAELVAAKYGIALTKISSLWGGKQASQKETGSRKNLYSKLRPWISLGWSFGNKLRHLQEKHLKGKTMLFYGNPSFLTPVIEEVKRKGNSPLYFDEFLGPKILKRLISKQIEVRSLWDGFALKFLRLENFLEKEWEKAFSEKTLGDELSLFFKVDSLPFYPLIRDRVTFLRKKLFARLIFFLSCIESLLRKEKPDTVLVDEDLSEKKKGFVLLAKSLGIRTVVLMHGVPARKIGYVPLSADVMAIWGEVYKKCLTEWGITEERLVVTGNPRYDGRGPHGEKNGSLGFIENEILGTRPILLALNKYRESWRACFYGEYFTYSEMEENIRKVCEVLSRLPQYSLIVKLHPRDPNPESYRNMVKKMKALYPRLKITLARQENIFDLISRSEIVLTVGSSVAVDALWLGKPSFLLDFFHHEEVYSYLDSKVIPRIQSVEELQRQIELLESSKRTQETLDRNLEVFFYKRDGQASRRIVELLEK